MTIRVASVEERQVEWRSERPNTNLYQGAIIRNGKLAEMSKLHKDVIEGDPEGVIAFIQAIMKAIEETKK